MRKPKQSELYKVCNLRGQFIGRYRAFSADEAVRRCLDCDRVNGSQFKRYSFLKFEELKAAVDTEEWQPWPRKN